jgi:fructose-bisphosphate aldolase, class II
MRLLQEIMKEAWQQKKVIPAFNIPYLPMMEPVVRALHDTDSFGLIMVARLEWIKFQAGGLQEIHGEYQQVKDERCTRLHLDHVPVVDEDGCQVDFEPVIRRAIDLGYHSVMIDGSRLPLEENIQATQRVVEWAHAAGIPVEAELGAVWGHEAGPLPPYEELYASGKGFTDPAEAVHFVASTGTDWLSVAVGNLHGTIAVAQRKQKKAEARINIGYLDRISRQTAIPLVLHGGTGIRRDCIHEAIAHGIAKINIGTGIRQPYESLMESSIAKAQEAVYDAVRVCLVDELCVAGSAKLFSS